MLFKIIDSNNPYYSKATILVQKILRDPINLPFDEVEIEEEKKYIRIAGFQDSELIATALLVPDKNKLKMQRVAVDSGHQNSGIGSKLLKFCEDFAIKNNYQEIYCHARDADGKSAVNFYLKNNYFADGDKFNEDGIAHLKMRKILK